MKAKKVIYTIYDDSGDVYKDNLTTFDVVDEANVIGHYDMQDSGDEEVTTMRGAEKYFKMIGYSIERKKQMKLGGDVINTNDACIKSIVSMIDKNNKVKDFYIHDSKLIVNLNDELMLYSIDIYNANLSTMKKCLHIVDGEFEMGYGEEYKTLILPLKTSDFKVGKFNKGGWIESLTYDEKNFCKLIANNFMGVKGTETCENDECLKSINKERLKQIIIEKKEQMSKQGLELANSILQKL